MTSFPKELIRQFVDERLDGDVSKLATYELRFLNGDRKYGNPKGRIYDADDTELMRAVYSVVFEDAWPNVEENLKSYVLRGDTLNTFATMFGKVRNDYRPEVHPGLDQHNPSAEIIRVVEDFYRICWTIGNMTVLPNLYVGRNTINLYRGCHYDWHDYEDRFLLALYQVLTGETQQDAKLAELAERNSEFFSPYFGDEGWRKFIDTHFLNEYVNDDYVPVIRSKGYFYWKTWYMTDEQYLEETVHYTQFATKVILGRANKIIETLKSKIDL